MAISLILQTTQTCDRGVPSTMAQGALICAESLGEVLEILFFGSCSSGTTLWGYRHLQTIFFVQQLCYLIGNRALVLDWEPEGHAISISDVSRYSIPVCFIHKIP